MSLTTYRSGLLCTTLIVVLGLSACDEVQKSTNIIEEIDYSSLQTWPLNNEKIENDYVQDNILAENIYIILDGSGSMGESTCSGNYQSKMYAAIDSVSNFVHNVPPETNIGLYVFDNNSTSERIALTTNRQTIDSSLESIVSGGNTPLGHSLQEARNSIELQASRQIGYGTYKLIFITDGQASDYNKLEKELEDILTNTPIEIYTIGFCVTENHILNMEGWVRYFNAQSPEELINSLNSVLVDAEVSISEINAENLFDE